MSIETVCHAGMGRAETGNYPNTQALLKRAELARVYYFSNIVTVVTIVFSGGRFSLAASQVVAAMVCALPANQTLHLGSGCYPRAQAIEFRKGRNRREFTKGVVK